MTKPVPETTDPVKRMDAELLASGQSASFSSDAAVAINNESQLFVDDFLIEARKSAHRRLNRPQKGREPLVVADRYWEGQGCVYGSLVEDEGEYRLYYKGQQQATKLNFAQHVEKHGYGKYPICMARSRDGLSFSKDVIPGAAIPGTNVVFDEQVDDFTVLKDPTDPDPSRRYKMLSSYRNWWAGLTPATSPDGIHWTWGKENAVTFFGDRCSYWYDPIRRKHIAWSRNYQIIEGRTVCHKETDDFDNWSDERSSHPRLVMQPDRYDHEKSQFYGAFGFWYRSVYLAYLEVYYIHSARIDTQLCCSRDGIKWTRLCDRDVFLPNGEHGDFDAYWVVPTFNPPVFKNGKLLIHYGGRPEPHAQPGFAHIPPGMGGAFALATLREDGFVSLDSTGSEGVVETRPLKIPENGALLEVNACPFDRRPGWDPMRLTLEVLGPDGACLFSHSIPTPADADQVWHSIPRTGNWPPVVRLRFRMFNTRLYSFRFRSPG